MKTNRSSNQGVALLIVLSFVVLLTVIVVALSESMRLDRPAAKSYLEKMRATQFAQMGVDSVVATFRKETGDISASKGRNWIAQPGQIIVGGTSGSNLLVLQETPVPLFSGSSAYAGTAAVTGTGSFFNPPNLNVTPFRSGSAGGGVITDMPGGSNTGATTEPLKLQPRWIYVRSGGQFDYDEKPATTGTNPIVGRFAYWSDDESSKVNYNIAWGRSAKNTNPAGNPTNTDLTALEGVTEAMAEGIRSEVLGGSLMTTGSTYYFFNTPEEARRVSVASAALQARKFEVTHYNHDPDTTFFNEPRIVLTTRPDRAGWTYKNGVWIGKNGKSGKDGRPYYIRVLTNEGSTNNPLNISSGPTDPGILSNLDPGNPTSESKVSETIKFLMTYLKRPDWPMLSGTGSIQSKYYGNYPSEYQEKRLAQLAVNIIDYVRSKESPTDLVEPLRVSLNATGNYDLGQVFGTYAYIGQTRAPRITEIGYWQSKDNKSAKWKVELYLPLNYGLAKIPVTSLHLIHAGKVHPGGGTPTQRFADITTAEASKADLMAGDYVTITRNGTVADIPTTRPEYIDARITIAAKGGSSGGARYNLCSLVAEGSAYPAANSYLLTKVDPAQDPANPKAGPSDNDISSLEVDDPRLNAEMRNWNQKLWSAGSKGNTFGAVNSISSLPTGGSSPTVSGNEPQQDTNALGKISVASFYMPPPAGKKYTLSSGVVDDNTPGMVTSSGELGYVHTGIESSRYIDYATKKELPTGVPWRSLRLQPNKQDEKVVPDWAFIDLFTAPVPTPRGAEYVYAPGAKVEGRENAVGGRVNLNCKPALIDLTRISPLVAVLKGCGYDSSNPTKKLTPAEALRLATNIYNRTPASDGKPYAYKKFYGSPGQIVEIKEIADRGEEGEELFRQIANLLTTRGSVISVYSIGQALKQTTGGKLLVTGEQRFQTMIERVEYSDSKDTINPRKVRFAPVYVRNLTP